MRDDERFTPADELPPGLYERTQELVAAAALIDGYDVPWVAGRSKDGKQVYRDRLVPQTAGGVETGQTLPFHELAEWLRMNEGETYDDGSDPPGTAHYDANGVEKIEVERLGGHWQKYCEAFRPVIREVDDEMLKDLPPLADWDTRPFEDDDRALLAQIDAAEKSTFAAPASATDGLNNYDLEGARARRRKRRKKLKKTAADPATEESAMDDLKLFIPITKIDAAKRLVYGVATAEKPDVTKEICDYASTKPLYQKWSENFAKTTDGKSLGNLRAMHGNVAAGKLTDLAFNDEAKQIEIAAKVVDDVEWAKVEEGVYTGFSQGGKYVKRWKDGDFTRYTAEPVEVSLVDSPCLPDATFSVIKADGTTELRKFKAVPAASAPGAEKIETPNDNSIGRQVWVNDALPGKMFTKKADLERALLDHAAEQTAQKAAAPVLEAIAGIKEKLGLDKGGHADPGNTVTVSFGDLAKQYASLAEDLKKAASPEDLRRILIAQPTDVIEAIAGSSPEVAKRTYSTEQRKEYAKQGIAMKDGSYPIPDKDALEDAIHAFGRAKNKAATKRHIIKRAKALKATDMLPEDWPGSTKDKESKKRAAAELAKATSAVQLSWLFDLFDRVMMAEDSAEAGATWGGVEVPKALTDRFGAMLVEFGDILAEMVDLVLADVREEEANEAMANAALAGSLQKLAALRALAKAGAKHAKADKDRIKQAHDLLVELDDDCCPGYEDNLAADDAEKVAKLLGEEKAGREADRKAFEKQLGEIHGIVKAIAAQPLPMGTSSVTLRVADKADDAVDFNKIADQLEAGATGAAADDDGLRRLGEAVQRRARAGSGAR